MGISVAGVVDIIIPLIENKYKLVKPGVRLQPINNKLPTPINIWTNLVWLSASNIGDSLTSVSLFFLSREHENPRKQRAQLHKNVFQSNILLQFNPKIETLLLDQCIFH